MVNNLPAIQEALGSISQWENPLEKGMAARSSILPWRIPWTEEAAVHRVAKSQTRLSDYNFLFLS